MTNQILKIYVLGNPLVRKDSMPLKIIDDLQKSFPQIKFVMTDPNENFPPEEEKDLIILDTVLGLKEPMVLDLNSFKAKKQTPISLHDYDLLLHLLLLKKTSRINNVRIIGIPPSKKVKSVLTSVVSLIGQL